MNPLEELRKLSARLSRAETRIDELEERVNQLERECEALGRLLLAERAAREGRSAPQDEAAEQGRDLHALFGLGRKTEH